MFEMNKKKKEVVSASVSDYSLNIYLCENVCRKIR